MTQNPPSKTRWCLREWSRDWESRCCCSLNPSTHQTPHWMWPKHSLMCAVGWWNTFRNTQQGKTQAEFWFPNGAYNMFHPVHKKTQNMSNPLSPTHPKPEQNLAWHRCLIALAGSNPIDPQDKQPIGFGFLEYTWQQSQEESNKCWTIVTSLPKQAQSLVWHTNLSVLQ